MIRSNDIPANKPRIMDAGSLAPLVAEFGHKLKALGHSHLTVMGYDASARHFGQWMMQDGIEIAEIDEAIIKRFARHHCHWSYAGILVTGEELIRRRRNRGQLPSRQ